MFTGIVEEAGVVQRIERSRKGIHLHVRMRVCAKGTRAGDSIAVNGCCLTVAALRRTGAGAPVTARFDLLEETWSRTNLQFCVPGSLVNLERSLRADSRLGGHFVTGHIDGMGIITRWEPYGADRLLELAAPPDILRYVVFKGSIAVDGISLTVAEVLARQLRIWIIPHTYEVTAMKERSVGDRVNLEPDLLAKYVEKFTSSSISSRRETRQADRRQKRRAAAAR